MGYVAALYTCGKVFTGTHHGDAFSKMNIHEKEQEIISGFFDSVTGTFITDDDEFYIKKILLIRHATVNTENDPRLTGYGIDQSKFTAEFLKTSVDDISEYKVFSSTSTRCKETSTIISQYLNIPCQSNEELVDKKTDENVVNFMVRIKKILHHLPQKIILISHCNFIINAIQLTAGIKNFTEHNPECLSFCSVTFVDNQKIIWFGKKVY